MSNKYLFFPFFGLLVPFFFYSVYLEFSSATALPVEVRGEYIVTTESETYKETSLDSGISPEIVFVGDVLLARNVEYLMDRNGPMYPFKHIESIFEDAPFIVGNFESAILEQHRKTPSYVTTFSVDKKFIPSLALVGFTHFSLANNHSFDYGTDTFTHTKFILSESGLVNFGHPQIVNANSISTFVAGNQTVSMLAINSVFTKLIWSDIETQIKNMASTSDFQIVYIHWGDEYTLKHNQTQEFIAHKLIDAGIDAVIGHHPHVTQDIEIYKNKPIFYSLGNFLFDQYFSVDVQQGLVLKLVLTNSTADYTLMPISSENSLSQPHSMSAEDASIFLKNLSRRSDPLYVEDIKQGRLILPL